MLVACWQQPVVLWRDQRKQREQRETMQSGVLIRLVLSQIFIYGTMAGARMSGPLLVLRDGHGAFISGLLVSCFALAPALLTVAAGRFAERHGLHKPVALCVLMAVIGMALAIAAPQVWVLCLSGALAGAATNAASVTLLRHASRSVTDPLDLKKAYAWLSIGPALSSFMGPFFAGLMIDHAGTTPGDDGGYRSAYLMLAAFAVVSWLLLRSLPEAPRAAQADANQGNFFDLLKTPGLLKLLFVNWCIAASWDVHNVIVPVLGHERGYSAAVIGSILGGLALAATSVRIIMPLFAARIREHVMITLALVTSAIMFALYPFTNSAQTMGLASIMLGFTVGAVQPLVVVLMHNIAPEGRQAEALGLRLAAINASNVLTPILCGTLGVAIGVSAVFWLASAALASGVRPAWSLRSYTHGRRHA